MTQVPLLSSNLSDRSSHPPSWWSNWLSPDLPPPSLPVSLTDYADCHFHECRRDQWSGARWVSRRQHHKLLSVWVFLILDFTFSFYLFFFLLARCGQRSLISRPKTFNAPVWGSRAPHPRTRSNNIGSVPAIARVMQSSYGLYSRNDSLRLKQFVFVCVYLCV